MADFLSTDLPGLALDLGRYVISYVPSRQVAMETLGWTTAVCVPVGALGYLIERLRSR